MPKNILVFAAHPDDEVIGCGGTIAKFANLGSDVQVVYFADGVGARLTTEISNYNVEHSARRAAAYNAAQILGINSLIFGDFPDNRMDSVELLEIIKFIESCIERVKPEIVLTHHANDLNIDHRRVHQAVVTACRPQPGHYVETLMFFEVCSSTEWQTSTTNVPFAPNWFVDISDYLEIRSKALEAYAMELRPWPHSRSLKAISHLAHWRGASIGVNAAEAFMLGRNIS